MQGGSGGWQNQKQSATDQEGRCTRLECIATMQQRRTLLSKLESPGMGSPTTGTRSRRESSDGSSSRVLQMRRAAAAALCSKPCSCIPRFSRPYILLTASDIVETAPRERAERNCTASSRSAATSEPRAKVSREELRRWPRGDAAEVAAAPRLSEPRGPGPAAACDCLRSTFPENAETAQGSMPWQYKNNCHISGDMGHGLSSQAGVLTQHQDPSPKKHSAI